MTTNNSASIGDLLDRIEKAGESDEVSVSTILEASEQASIAALLLVPALAMVTPLSGVPGLSTVCGVMIALIGAQLAVGRDHVWLPRTILKRRVKRKQVHGATQWLRKPAGVIDRMTRRRLPVLVAKPFSTVFVAICALAGALTPLLELIPFSSSLLGCAVSVLAVALVVRDGLLSLLALAILIGVAVLVGVQVT